jgi:hypothetical protein
MSRSNNTTSKIRRAVRGRGFITPRFSNTVRWLMILIGKLYLKIFEGVINVDFIHEERIIDAMKRFHTGEHRLIFVFRHAAKEDPPVLMYALSRPLRRKIEKGRNLSHLRFLYGRDVPNWAGGAAAWFFPKIGAIPVQNRGGNREALNLLRLEMREGRFPIALAPEEQIVYHMYHTSNIAPGISSLVRWGQDSGKPVTIVPLALGYTYGKDPKKFIIEMLTRWETETGLYLVNPKTGELYPLLNEAADQTISLLEHFYSLSPAPEADRRKPDKIDERIKLLCEAVLSAAEETAGLSSEGDGMDRLFRIRYAGVDSFYPESLDPAVQPKLQRALLDFKALKAEVSIRHSQIVDVLKYIHMSYIEPPFSPGRGCEFILNLLDLINRVQGGNIESRFTPSGQKSVVLAGEPLLYDEASAMEMSRRGYLDKIKSDVKTAFDTVSSELETEWETVKLK